MKRKLLKITMIILIIIAIIVVAAAVFMNMPQFGKLPSGERKERIEKSPNYKNGKFENINHTPQLTSDSGFIQAIIEYLFTKYDRQTPLSPLPSIKTDLKNIDKNEDILVWFGHSSLFLQLSGVSFLIDPVFSDYASPVAGINKAFIGSNIYTAEDMPQIDYLIFSHDHWDHIDYPTLKTLKNSTTKIIAPLGVGEHFEHWGFDKNLITELDWNEATTLKNNIELHCLPARHFSGRALKRDQTLWASFLIKTQDYKFYHSADSGYDTHFAQIGEKFGEIDFATLENGQYNEGWKFIHMLPFETVQAAKDLNAKRAMPIHNSKFVLSKHSWDAPLKDVLSESKTLNINLATPMIGQKVQLRNNSQIFENWWEKID